MTTGSAQVSGTVQTSTTNIVTDITWKGSTTGPVGWTSNSFNDTSWGYAVEQDPSWHGNPTTLIPDTTAKTIWYPSSIYWNTSNAYFRKSINLTQVPTSATLNISVDDDYELYVNGTLVGVNNDNGWAGTQQYNVLNMLVIGQNEQFMVLMLQALR